jgi:hypothetical protein
MTGMTLRTWISVKVIPFYILHSLVSRFEEDPAAVTPEETSRGGVRVMNGVVGEAERDAISKSVSFNLCLAMCER